MAGEFIADVEQIRKRAREHMEEGPVTGAYQGDPKATIAILQQALATEIVCVLRYRHHYYMATGLHGDTAAREFLEHAQNEQEHADRIANRIQQLGGSPDMNPTTLMERSFSEYAEGESLGDMIKEDLIAERVVIEVYNEMIRHFGFDDITTREMLEDILGDEEEHAADLSDLFYLVDPRTGEAQRPDPALSDHQPESPKLLRDDAAVERVQRTAGARPPERNGAKTAPAADRHRREPQGIESELANKQPRRRRAS
jgi:bacterioferritin